MKNIKGLSAGLNDAISVSKVPKFLKMGVQIWINRTVQVDKQPTLATWILLIVGDLLKLRKPSIQKANRFYFANRVEARVLEDAAPPPSISALVVSTRKDFNLLRLSLKNLQNGSRNPVIEITVIVPNRDVGICLELIDELRLEIPVIVLDEDKVLPLGLRMRIKKKFGDRYGWVLQQLLIVDFVLRSDALGILVLDSDTILSQQLLWLDQNSKQLLMPSWEFNSPYYEFLRNIAPKIPYAKSSFISHHMMMQPKILRAIFENLQIKNTDDLFLLVEKFAGSENESAVCLEFEIYAQGLLAFFPQKCLITKWSNISLSFADESKMYEKLELLLQRKIYRSISVHSWSQK